MARPTAYKAEYAEQAYKLCLLGAKDKELANFFKVTEQTITSWKKKHPKFIASLKAGKENADAAVAESLYKRALGYTCKEDKVLQHEGIHTDTVTINKHYPPDVTAAIFWLKNRQRQNWRDKQEIEHSGDVSFTVER